LSYSRNYLHSYSFKNGTGLRYDVHVSPVIIDRFFEWSVLGQPSGPCFLNVIIGKATVNTIATVKVLRNSIANLVVKMSEFNRNVKFFNNHVTYLNNALASRMEPVPELMMNLFKGYSSAADYDFVRYIQNKKDAYEDGATMSVEQLMSAALNKYELKVEDGRWSVPDKKDDRIIALKAENATLRASKSKKRGTRGNKVEKISMRGKRLLQKLVTRLPRK
jgi:hypothetical protein